MIASGVRAGMPSLARRLTALAACLAQLTALPAGAQAPPAGEGLSGSWTGWARLTNDWPGQTCRYEGAADTTSVRLELGAEGGRLRGSVAMDLPPAEGSGCPPLRKRYTIDDVVVAEGSVSFIDSGGNEWTLSQRRGGGVLLGLLAWRAGGPEAPLDERFTLPGGTRPLTHLSGEVRLKKAVEGEAEAPASASETEGTSATAPPKKTSAGTRLGHLGLVLGANAVALGILYGVNKAGKGGSESGVVTCSPRVCVVGALNEPCFCEGNVVSGVPCGTTTAGVPAGGVCDGRTLPCQATLSCNSGICEDRFGRCPY